jgi:nickel transport protein
MGHIGLLTLLVFALLLPGRALAHDLHYSVEQGPAVYVRLYFGGGEEFSFEKYEIYRNGEEIPFQVGRTDVKGRLVFLPDRPGTWRVKAFSEDGHGVDISVTTDAKGGVEGSTEPRFDRHARIIMGVSLIFGIFGLINLFVRRRSRK